MKAEDLLENVKPESKVPDEMFALFMTFDDGDDTWVECVSKNKEKLIERVEQQILEWAKQIGYKNYTTQYVQKLWKQDGNWLVIDRGDKNGYRIGPVSVV